ncbi:MAG: DUF4255 domain-containing protein [Bacteroidia bacterium]
MDYTALEEITETIIHVIKTAVDMTNNWPPTLSVSPELLKDTNEGIGFYLYHVQENSHYKNYPAPGKDNPPVNYTPMALNLFYQLSANKRKNDNEDAYDEQRLMSVAMKALHDNAIITKTIATPEKKVNLKITLQTLTPSESVQYWAAGESPVRLSAYYEVSVVFLQPEISTSHAGRVLSYGNYIFVQGAPRIISIENIIEYSLPGNPERLQVKIQPAQAPPAHALPAPPLILTPAIDSEINFIGSGFGGGDLKLFLISKKWNEPVIAGTDWQVKLVAENQLTAIVQETAKLESSPLTSVDILPGIYIAQISITEQKTFPGGTVKEFRHISNQVPFSVMPRIDAIKKGAGGKFTIEGYRFQHVDLNPEDIQVYISDKRATLNGGGLLGDPHFSITAIDKMELTIPAGFPTRTLPLRIMINGVESPPNWITVP